MKTLINTEGLDKYLRTDIVGKCLPVWAERWRGFTLRRFVKMSRSGWKRLKRKRKRGKRKSAAVLIDTSTLLHALDIKFQHAPGALEKKRSTSILVGFGGPANHPSGKLTVATLASYHNEGKGRLPKRVIVVDELPARLIRSMRKDAERINRDAVRLSIQ